MSDSNWRSMQHFRDRIVMLRSRSSRSELSDLVPQISTMTQQRVRFISDCVSMESSLGLRASPDLSTSSSSNDSNTSPTSSSISPTSHKMANIVSRQIPSVLMSVSRRSQSAMVRMWYVVYSTPLGRSHRWMTSDSCGHRRDRSIDRSKRKTEQYSSQVRLDQVRLRRSTRCSRVSTQRIAR